MLFEVSEPLLAWTLKRGAGLLKSVYARHRHDALPNAVEMGRITFNYLPANPLAMDGDLQNGINDPLHHQSLQTSLTA